MSLHDTPLLFLMMLVLGLVALGILRNYLATRNRMRLRQMIHEERLKALEKEAPLDDLTYDGNLEREFVGSSSGGNGNRAFWLRLTALCVGLVCSFVGVGMIVAFLLATDPELTKIWSVGMIPMMLGFGLLLFYVLTRELGLEKPAPTATE